jgi:tetratricopeptide (TPR) repeat protein
LSRFDHLELGSEPAPEPDEPESGVVDQNYYTEKADAAFLEGNFERALAFFSRSLQYDINLEESWVGQIRCLIELKELQEAVIWSERALTRFPNSAEVLAARGVAECRMGNAQAAIRFADAALSTKKITPYLWTARGEILISSNAANARACFLKAAEMAPGDIKVYAGIGRAYLVHGCNIEAAEYLQKAVRIDSGSYICWYWLGKCTEAMGDMKEAENCYGRAVAANPAFGKARDALHVVSRRGIGAKISGKLRRMFGVRKVVEG